MSTTIHIISFDQTGALPVEALARAMGGADVTSLTLPEIQSGEANTTLSPARTIVMDIGMHGEEALPQIKTVLQACPAGARIIATGYVNDLGFYRTLRSLNIVEYFLHPVSVDEVARAFSQPLTGSATTPQASSVNEGSVIAVVSAAAGDGGSTVALNTAIALAQETQQAVVLVDMDYQYGMVARNLDINAPYGLRELFEHPKRGVDATLLSRMLMPYGDHLRVIAAPSALQPMPEIPAEMMRDIITVLRSQFAFVIIDLPHLWSPWVAETLRLSDRTVCVAQLWLRSLTHFSRMLAAWQEHTISRDRLLLAINRSGAKFREAITPQDFERVSLQPINFYLANDTRAMVEAENQGKTVIELGSSQLERQFREMARSLRMLQHHSGAITQVEQQSMQDKRGLRGLLSWKG